MSDTPNDLPSAPARAFEGRVVLITGGGSRIGRATASLVNVASVAGVNGFPRHTAYAASKHGVVGLTRSAAIEYARAGIRVNALCPGFTATPMVGRMTRGDPAREAKLAARVTLGRLRTVGEVAAAVVSLCSDAAVVRGGARDGVGRRDGGAIG